MSAVTQPSAPVATRRDSFPLRPADLTFTALLVLGAAVVLVETRGMTFFGDEWDFVVARRGLTAHTLLTPHGPHLSLVPILVFKVLLAVFGGGSYLPFRLLAAFDLVIVSLALGVACRDRWGPWWGLAPVLLLITLGPGGVTLLWPFQDGYALAVALGLAALVALDRRGRWADPICCGALLVSLASASQGIGFVAGAAVMLVGSGDWRRRIWVIAVPAVLYVAWYLGYGHQYSETHISLWNTSLPYVVQALSATSGTVAGLSSVSPQTGLLDTTYGAPIALALLAAVATGSWRGWRPRPIFWGSAATLVVVLFAASLSNWGPFSRPPNDPRYVSSDAALLMLCLCAARPRPRLPRLGVVVALLVLLVIAATNADGYRQQHHMFVDGSRTQRAELGALDLMQGIVPADYSPAGVDVNLSGIDAAGFFSAREAFGLPEATPREMLAEPDATRDNVDRILAPTELSLSPTPVAVRSASHPLTVLAGTPEQVRGCLVVGAAPLVIQTPPGLIAITTSGRFPASITAARFGSGSDFGVGNIATGSTATLVVHGDRAPQVPWRITMTGTGAHVCAGP